MAAIAHSVAGDEIPRNSLANYAFEHFEIAADKSLLVMAEEGGFTGATPLLKQSLGEEQDMAQWIDDVLPRITKRYATLYVTDGSYRQGVSTSRRISRWRA